MNEHKQPSLRELCLQYTNLGMEDVCQLETMAGQLSFVSELTQTDIFIDALTSNGVDAIVLAWAGGADIFLDCFTQPTPSFVGTPMDSSPRVTF